MTTYGGLIPVPPTIESKVRIYDLKSRLDWGEPALTIIDVRDRDQFNNSHIMGAISFPMNELSDRALMSLELTRDIYVYGETDEMTAEAAMQLRQAGYLNVAEISGGLAAWKAAGYSIEGNATTVA